MTIHTTLALIGISDLVPILIVVVLVAFGFIIFNLMNAAEQANNQAKWKSLATRLNLTHKDSFFFRPLHIRGTYKGVEIRAENYEIEQSHGHGPTRIMHRNIFKAQLQNPLWKEVKIIRYEAAEHVAIA